MELSLINSSWSRIVFWNTDPRLYTCAKPAKPAKLQCKHPMQCIGTNTSPRATRAGGAAGQSKYRIKNKKMKNKRQGKETPGTNERRRRRKKRKKKKKKKKKLVTSPGSTKHGRVVNRRAGITSAKGQPVESTSTREKIRAHNMPRDKSV